MLRDDAGSSPVEFVLVGTLLTALTLAVLQIAVAVYVSKRRPIAIGDVQEDGAVDPTPTPA